MLESGSYWRRTLMRRLSRRRALIAAGASGVALAAAACGGDGDGEDSGASDGGSSLLAKPVDRTKDAVPGGIFQAWEPADIQGFDPNGGTSARAQLISYFCYLRMVKNKTTFNGVRTEEKEGDLAQSWEFSGDGLQLTFKLRQGVIWDRRAPTSGRTVDSEDVSISAERFLKQSPNATNFFNEKSPAAPIKSIETPDKSTVVMKLAFPYVPLIATFARSLNMWILPREAAQGGFDPRNEVRGAGPWVLDSYRPSAGLEFKRNPDYYVKDRPYLDGWSAPIVTEYATQLSQFRAGNIWAGVGRQEDILGLKRDIPQLGMFQGDYGIGTPLIYFGFEGAFKDARVRQAVSHLVDRQLIADTLANTKQYTAAGLPRDIRINTHIGAGWEGYWVDPFGKDFGSNAHFYMYDVAEARKLLTAAGITGKLSSKFAYPTSGYGVAYQQLVDILGGMLNDSGLLDVKLTPVDYQSDYIPNYHFGGGKWDGMAVTPAAQGDEAGHQLQVQYHSKGAATRQPTGLDPKLDEMIEAQLRETDTRKRTTQIQDIQRYMPTTMIAVPVSYQSAGYSLAWPWVGNYGAVRGGPVPYVEVYPFLWFDKAAYEKNKP